MSIIKCVKLQKESEALDYQPYPGDIGIRIMESISAEAWKMWMDHQNEHDYHAPLGDQLKWIKDSGFINAECVWRHLLWSVLIAKK